MVQARIIDPPPRRTFVVGDIHGCTEELDLLIRHLESEGLGSEDLVVFVGDYIDRGPDSKGVISRLIEFKAKYGATIFLRGNHEDMLVAFLKLPVQTASAGSYGKYYLQNGGVQLLESYGLAENATPEQLSAILPADHLNFICSLESFIQIGNYVIVHAGLNPGQPYGKQRLKDLCWIRDEFIFHSHTFGKTVVFGHTPYQNIFLDLPYKIGIDTGLVYGNALSCLELSSTTVYRIERGDTIIGTFNLKDVAEQS